MKLPSVAARAAAAALPYLVEISERASLSCSPSTSNACLVDQPGGLFSLEQFYDYNPATGPSNSFTIHGLWPDHCDGTYDATCDSSRAESNIGSILQNAGKQSVLDYMNTYWVDINGNNPSFWSHEWNKHGTCVSTIRPQCYTSYSNKQDVVDYFTVATTLHKKYDTYQVLVNAGITPGSGKTYTKSQMQTALKNAFGYYPALHCSSGYLNGAGYYHETSGRATTATNFVLRAPLSGTDSCPSTGIKWLPKQ